MTKAQRKDQQGLMKKDATADEWTAFFGEIAREARERIERWYNEAGLA